MRKLLPLFHGTFISLFGNSQFFAPETIVTSYAHTGRATMFDIDGDGDDDIVQNDAFSIGYVRTYVRNGIDFDALTYPVMMGSTGSFYDIKGHADFDMDGDEDIFNGYGWTENDNGQFNQSHYFLPEMHYGEQAASGDINGDGFPDVVISNARHGSNHTGYRLMILLNDGTGLFTDVSTEVSNPTSVQLRELNDDGNLDMVFFNGADDKWYYYEGHGDGTFEPVSVLLTDLPWGGGLMDVNDDGLLDLTYVSNSLPTYEGDLHILMGLSGLSFQSDLVVHIPTWDLNWGNIEIRVVDYDNDGDMDIVLFTSADILLVENNDSGFTYVGVVGQCMNYASSLFWTQINDDNIPDLLETTDDLLSYVQDENGQLKPFLLACEGGCYAGSSFVMIDEDDNGQQEMLSITESGNVVLNTINEFNYVSSRVLGVDVYGTFKAHLDFNRDGMKDIILGSYDGLTYLEKESDLRYKFQTDILGDLAGSVFAIDEFDVDGDYSKDLVVGVSSDVNEVYWYKYVDANGWQLQGMLADIGESGLNDGIVRMFHEGDFNGDGLSDLGVLSSRTCTFLIRQVDNSLVAHQVFITADPNEVILTAEDAVADFNQDGKDDLMFLQKSMVTSLKKFFIARHNGTSFESVLAHQFTFDEYNTGYPKPIWTLTDLDFDGDQDIVYSNFNQIKRSMNNVIGFSSSQTLNISATSAIYGIYAEDIDDDQMPDLIFGGPLGATGAFVQTAINNLDSPYQVNISAFIDYNGDGIKNGFDVALINQQIALSGDWGYAFTDEEGLYTFYGVEGDYTLSMSVDEDIWSPVTPFIQSVSLTEADPISNLIFAITPNNTVYDVQGQIITMADVCGSDYGHWINIYNAGNTIADGTVTYTLADGFTYTWGSPSPTSVVGNVITWEYQNLDFNESITYTITAASPGVESIGSTVSHTLEVITLDVNGDVVATSLDENTYVIECAYDPNDLTENMGWSEPGYIAEDGMLEYTIRFQNLGNAPAVDVRVENLLSELHHKGTVIAVAASHDYIIDEDAEGRLNFFFENINLPAAEDDEPGSHGFITFRIKPISGLTPGTEIQHHASIYFDLNPPIVTNEVTNTILDCETLDINLSSDVCNESDILVSTSRDEFVDYTWYSGESVLGLGMNTSVSFADPGLQTLRLEVANPICTVVTEVNVDVQASPEFTNELINAVYCGEPVLIEAHGNGDVSWFYQDSEIGVGDELLASDMGIYTAVLTNICGSTEWEVTVFYGEEPGFSSISDDAVLCDVPIELSAYGNGTVVWYSNDEIIGTSEQINLIQTGLYRVEVTTACGTVEEEILVTQGLLPELTSVTESAMICDEPLTLYAEGIGLISWNDPDGISTVSPSIEVLDPGVYHAVVTTECGSIEQEVNVELGVMPELLNVSEDVVVCGEAVLLSAAANGELSWYYGEELLSLSNEIEVETAGNYHVVAETACGSISQDILVSAGVVPEFFEIPDLMSLCDEAIVLVGSGSGDITWYFGDVVLGTQSEVSVSEPGVYRAELNNICGTLNHEIVVEQFEEPTFNDVSEDMILCDQSLSLSANGNGSIQWFSMDELIEEGANLEVIEAGVYLATVSNVCGTVSHEIVIGAGELPVFNSWTGEQVMCGGNVSLEAIGNGDVTWYLGETVIGEGNSIVVDEAGTYHAVLSTACGNAEVATIVLAGAIPEFSNYTESATLCDDFATIHANGPGDITWFLGEMVIGNSSEVEVSEAGVYMAVLSNVCGMNSVEIDVLPATLPVFSISPVSGESCGEPITTMAEGTQGEMVSWFADGLLVGTGQEYVVTSSVDLTAVLDNGCATSATEVSFVIHDLISVTLEYDALNDLVIATEGFETYSWTDNGVPVVDVTGNTYSPQSDEIEVVAEDANGCLATAAIVIIYVEDPIREAMSVYPNPADEWLNVILPTDLTSSAMDLFDEWGKLVISQRITPGNTEVMNVSQLASGVYTLRCGNVVRKVSIR